jgi:uncharacterized protein (DUF1697 family)
VRAVIVRVMPRYLALLRGVNVGGKKLAMSDLRDVAEQLGYTGVSTYIQSGNLLFRSEESDQGGLAQALEGEIAGRLGLRSDVVVLTAANLSQVIADNPFPDEANPRALHAVLHQHEISEDGRARVAGALERAAARGCTDEAAVAGRAIYLHTPDGIGRSELAVQLGRVHKAGTARNWATVTKLMGMLEATGASGE